MKFNKFIYLEDFSIKDDRVHMTEKGLKKIKKYKKITGTRLSAVINKNKYVSNFQVWCDIMGFYVSEADGWFLDAGICIEPKIVDYLNEYWNIKLTTYNPKVIKFDAFHNEEIFGGIPDGESIVDGKLNFLVEIKTSSINKYKMQIFDNELSVIRDEYNYGIISERGKGITKWFNDEKVSIPEEYCYQLGLYLYLKNINVGYFAIFFLEHEDYKKPYNFDVKNSLLIIEEMEVDREGFKDVILEAEEWYKEHILKGISPKLTPKDFTWFRFGYINI